MPPRPSENNSRDAATYMPFSVDTRPSRAAKITSFAAHTKPNAASNTADVVMGKRADSVHGMLIDTANTIRT